MENILKRMYRKLLFICLVSMVMLTGCSENNNEDEASKDKDELLMEELKKPFDASKKEEYEKVVALLVGDEPVYVDEAVWYVFLIEDSMKVYSQTYEEEIKEPYWEQKIEGGSTMGQIYTDDVIGQIAYNKFLADKGREEKIELNSEEIDKKTEKIWGSVSKEDIEKYGLSKEGYKKMISNWELSAMYLELLGEELEIDEEDLKNNNPKEEFEGKINTEFLIVQNTYVDKDGNKQTKDNATIEKLQEELDKARQDVINGMTMEDAANKYENVSYYTSSIYKGTNSASGVFEENASKLAKGEVSPIIKEALNTYVIRRLEDTKDLDYEEYIQNMIK